MNILGKIISIPNDFASLLRYRPFFEKNQKGVYWMIRVVKKIRNRLSFHLLATCVYLYDLDCNRNFLQRAISLASLRRSSPSNTGMLRGWMDKYILHELIRTKKEFIHYKMIMRFMHGVFYSSTSLRVGLCSSVKFDTLDFGYNDMTEFIVLCLWIKHLNHSVPLSHQGLKLWDDGYPQVPSIRSTRCWQPRDYYLLYEK